MATGDDKIAFVKFCAEKDLNGIQLLKSALPTVEHLSGIGMTITQIHAVVRMLEEKETKIHNLKCRVQRQQRTLDSIQTALAGV
jgi:Leu/Phe-tRNA-protein transferase